AFSGNAYFFCTECLLLFGKMHRVQPEMPPSLVGKTSVLHRKVCCCILFHPVRKKKESVNVRQTALFNRESERILPFCQIACFALVEGCMLHNIV
ncbi:hypothetical protein BF9343_3537, partial [Bacteroides fragilis NCTC 9343]